MPEGGQSRPAPRRLRVIALDDQHLSVKGLRLTLAEVAEEFELVAAVPSLTALNGTGADVALLELSLRDGSAPHDNIAELQGRGIRVLIHTEVWDVHLLSEALHAGADGIVCKHHTEADLLEALRQVRTGERYVPDDVAELLELGRSQRPRLSGREIEVLNLLYEGLITKQAARRLNVSESTVKEHLKRIRQKYATLGRPVSTRVQLLQVAHRDGFISPRPSSSGA